MLAIFRSFRSVARMDPGTLLAEHNILCPGGKEYAAGKGLSSVVCMGKNNIILHILIEIMAMSTGAFQ
jgi:hypothetical protein